ncbi:motilin receptor [Protopterus annectens]|uniref:motilin receptor n=1 Tax=Protopterus annectens TaxID=7888 RepID=UPI001CF9F6F7|nr:motilin receptor [Protopterus annectens]
METRSNGSHFLEELFLCEHSTCSLFPVAVLIPVTVICFILFIVGVIGNSITLLIVRRYKDMNTTTNLYLSSMAVSDLIILFCLPFDLYRLWRSRPWIFGVFLCKCFHYLSEGCTYATILHITALSIERYLAVCFPLKAKVFITKRRVKGVIVFLWIFALLSAAPFIFLVGVEYENNTNHELTRECKPTEYAIHSGLLSTMLWVATIYLFIPMLCLNFLYGIIIIKLWKTNSKIRGLNSFNREAYHKQTVKILVVVVLAFAICWLPFHIGRIIFCTIDSISMVYFSQYFNMISMQLFYLSASINPILYNLLSKKYRTAAHKLMLSSRSSWRHFLISREETAISTEVSTTI